MFCGGNHFGYKIYHNQAWYNSTPPSFMQDLNSMCEVENASHIFVTLFINFFYLVLFLTYIGVDKKISKIASTRST
jgi:hypothetical protein